MEGRGAKMRKFLFWIIHNIPLGRLAPWVVGLAIGRRPHRIPDREIGYSDRRRLEGKNDEN